MAAGAEAACGCSKEMYRAMWEQATDEALEKLVRVGRDGYQYLGISNGVSPKHCVSRHRHECASCAPRSDRGGDFCHACIAACRAVLLPHSLSLLATPVPILACILSDLCSA